MQDMRNRSWYAVICNLKAFLLLPISVLFPWIMVVHFCDKLLWGCEATPETCHHIQIQLLWQTFIPTLVSAITSIIPAAAQSARTTARMHSPWSALTLSNSHSLLRKLPLEFGFPLNERGRGQFQSMHSWLNQVKHPVLLLYTPLACWPWPDLLFCGGTVVGTGLLMCGNM